MISDQLAQKVSKRLNYDLEETKIIFQDLDDRYIERAIAVARPQCMIVLTSFIEEHNDDIEVLSHLRGFKSSKEQLSYWEKWDKEIKEIRESFED